VPFAGVAASIGVFLLLLAFALNLAGKLERRSLTYQSLNIVGAALSCLAAVLISFWPFVVLEGCWALVACVAVINGFRVKNRATMERRRE
jgi:hypothetical protein